MSFAGSALSFIVALSLIVFVHEYGHYIVGRWTGIRAEVFSVGFGPRLISRRDRRGTLWQIAAIPLGGYVRFLGDADAASMGRTAVDPAHRRATLEGAPLWARAATIAAGPAANFLVSTLVFAGFLLVQGIPRDDGRVVVGEVAPLPPAYGTGLQPGDEIVALAGRPVTGWPDLPRLAAEVPAAPVQTWTVRRGDATRDVAGPDLAPPLVTGVSPGGAAAAAGLRPGDAIVALDGTPVARFDAIRPVVDAAAGAPVAVTLWRAGEGERVVEITPRRQDTPRPEGGFESRWLLGVTGGGTPFGAELRQAGPLEAVALGARQTWDVIAASLTGIVATVTGQVSACSVGGAISIAESTAQAASVGASQFLWWVAVLSVAIGFLNLLPIPVLDGGHLAFIAWEALTGRPPAPAVMNVLTIVGLALVLGLMLFGLRNDVVCP